MKNQPPLRQWVEDLGACKETTEIEHVDAGLEVLYMPCALRCDGKDEFVASRAADQRVGIFAGVELIVPAPA